MISWKLAVLAAAALFIATGWKQDRADLQPSPQIHATPSFDECAVWQQLFGSDWLAAFVDTTYDRVVEKVARTTPLRRYFPPPARILAFNQRVYITIEALNQQGYAIRYSTQSNCQAADCEYARFSGRGLSVFGSASIQAAVPSPEPLTGTTVMLRSGIMARYVDPQENSSQGFAALAFDQENNRYSIQIRGANAAELIELQQSMALNPSSRPSFALVAPVPAPTPRASGPTFGNPTPTPSPTPVPSPTPAYSQYSPHAGAAGSIIRISGKNLLGIRCVTIGFKKARIQSLSSDEVDVVVPTLPETGGLQIFASNGQTNIGDFSAIPDVTEPLPNHAMRSKVPGSDQSSNVRLANAGGLPPLLVTAAARLRRTTTAPVLLPTFFASDRVGSIRVAASSKTSYRVLFLRDGCKTGSNERCVAGVMSAEKMWPFAGAGFWKLHPIFSSSRQLFNGLNVAYVPYACEAACGMASLSFSYDQDPSYNTYIVELHWQLATWPRMRDIGDSLVEFSR